MISTDFCLFLWIMYRRVGLGIVTPSSYALRERTVVAKFQPQSNLFIFLCPKFLIAHFDKDSINSTTTDYEWRQSLYRRAVGQQKRCTLISLNGQID